MPHYTPAQLRFMGQRDFWLDGSFETSSVYRNGVMYDALVAKDPGAQFRLRVAPGRLTLRFNSHPWSGSVRLSVPGASALEVDLHNHQDDIRDVSVDVFQDGLLTVELLHPGVGIDKATELWLLELHTDSMLPGTPKVATLSDTVQAALGQHGTFLTHSRDTVIGAEIRRTGVWAERDLDLFAHYVFDGGTVLDIGSNVGHHVVFFSKQVGTSGHVLGFEPQRLIWRLAMGNLGINNCANADILPLALSDEAGWMEMYESNADEAINFGALGLRPGSEASESAQRVPVARLDDVLKDVEFGDRVDFMKIDVQSYELFVLRGAEETIRQYRPVIFFEVAPYFMRRAGYDYEDLYRYLEDLGYSFDHLDGAPIGKKPKEWSGRTEEEWDTLALPS